MKKGSGVRFMYSQLVLCWVSISIANVFAYRIQ